MAPNQTGSSWERARLRDRLALLAVCALVYPLFLATLCWFCYNESNFPLLIIFARPENERRTEDRNDNIIEVPRQISPFNHSTRAYFYSGWSCDSAKQELLMTSPKVLFMLSVQSPRSRVWIVLGWHIISMQALWKFLWMPKTQSERILGPRKM